MQRTMETRLNALPERTHTYVSIRVPTRRTGREECTRSSIHTLARRSGHFGRNPGCGTPLSYSSSCLEPVYARQVSSRRPLNRPFQVLRACSARACMCEWNTGLEGASLPPPMSQNGTERERFACSFSLSFFLSSFPSLSFSRGVFRFKWSLIGSVICRIDVLQELESRVANVDRWWKWSVEIDVISRDKVDEVSMRERERGLRNCINHYA